MSEGPIRYRVLIQYDGEYYAKVELFSSWFEDQANQWADEYAAAALDPGEKLYVQRVSTVIAKKDLRTILHPDDAATTKE